MPGCREQGKQAEREETLLASGKIDQYLLPRQSTAVNLSVSIKNFKLQSLSPFREAESGKP